MASEIFITGLIIFATYLWMAFCAQGWVQHRCWELFYYSHRLFIVFVALGALHTMDVEFRERGKDRSHV